jgi:phytoene synthase
VSSPARAILAAKSKSFALAGRLLGQVERDRAAVVYAFCRRADDAVDGAATGDPIAAVDRLELELDAIYAGRATGDPVLDAFGEVARACVIPRAYPAELLAGMAMDATGWRYHSLDDVLLYSYRVAGVVGLMMCHVLGLCDDRALPRAVHLGLAMQLTNICRDVEEDWRLGRLYLPDELLGAAGAPDLAAALGGPFPLAARRPAARVTQELLAEADRYYRSADRGIPDLPWRAGLAIRTARLVYAAIGKRMTARGCDPLAGRAVVPRRTKLALVGRAAWIAARDRPRRPRAPARPPAREVEFGRDLLAVS